MVSTDNHFIRALLRHDKALGINSEELLEEIGIPIDVLNEGSSVRISTNKYSQLVRRVWEISGDEGFGMTRYPCQVGLFDLMIRYVLQFETLEIVMREVCRFYRTVGAGFHFELDYTEDRVGFVVVLAEPELDVDHFLTELVMTTMHRLFCWITDRRIALIESTFIYPRPEYAGAYADLFPGDCSFNSESNGFYFDKNCLNYQVVRNWKEAKAFMGESPAGFITIPGSDDSMTTKLKGILISEYKKDNGFPELSAIARMLSLTEQTIRRKLIKENTNYQQIKTEIRRDIAIDKLVHSEQSVADIGFHIGFVEPSSFARAFHRWVGLSPSDYRAKYKKGNDG
ncbi:AraC family transcriptional regulator [Pseudomaricurvus alkylphenolicus]|jgi:AraC-like DNA-binding protein|uniref:AraC family transcriptional regulator n=1 Tax=Pseudomaricurvus alkylphenolicus TaxID=1306991 RepID=UPI0014230DFA|nr:AraC family transcriptional regulator [Pseudomaricurvus alkylphenolicus]NIB41697.1 AraC family transcriptional regulator [Pseudomaricurvus alkylphenolicus]